MGRRQQIELMVLNTLLSILAVLAGVGVMWVTGFFGVMVLEAGVPTGIQGIGWYPFVRGLAFFLPGLSPPSALLGAYVAALMAHRSESAHALAVGIIQLVFLLSLAFPLIFADRPLWVLMWYLPTLFFVIPAAALGGPRGRLRRERKAARSA